MSLSQKQREELKKNYFQHHYDSRDTIVPADIADYWLSKFDQLIQDKVEKIEKLREDDTNEDYDYGLETAITILKE